VVSSGYSQTPSAGLAHSLDREGRRAEHVFVGGQLEDGEVFGQPQLALDFFDGLARNIRPQLGDAGANQRRHIARDFVAQRLGVERLSRKRRGRNMRPGGGFFVQGERWHGRENLGNAFEKVSGRATP
jgi:hypothetical protein